MKAVRVALARKRKVLVDRCNVTVPGQVRGSGQAEEQVKWDWAHLGTIMQLCWRSLMELYMNHVWNGIKDDS